MAYFKDLEGKPHFLSPEDIGNGGMKLLPEGYVEITDQAAATLIAQLNVASRADLVATVDGHISGIYDIYTRFDQEYVAREAAARAFKAANYTGDPTSWVHAFAANAGKTDQEATDIIIGQADALRTALEGLGAQRMRKYGILAAADQAAAQALCDDIIAQADTIAATLS